MIRLLAAFLLFAPSIARADLNTIDINGGIDPEIADAFNGRIHSGVDYSKEIVIRIDTPGGDLMSAILMVRAMEDATRHGAHIRCVVDGFAASAGLYLLEGCAVRQMTMRSLLMAHEPFVMIDEPVTVGRSRALLARLVAVRHLYAAQCASRLRITLAEFLRRIDGREWWILPEEALRVGAIDSIAPTLLERAKR